MSIQSQEDYASVFSGDHYRSIESWKEQIIKGLPFTESVYESFYWPRLQCTQGVTVKPRRAPHCNFEVGSGILAPVFGWKAAKHCLDSQCLNFQRHLEAESAVAPPCHQTNAEAMWADFVGKSLKW